MDRYVRWVGGVGVGGWVGGVGVGGWVGGIGVV